MAYNNSLLFLLILSGIQAGFSWAVFLLPLLSARVTRYTFKLSWPAQGRAEGPRTLYSTSLCLHLGTPPQCLSSKARPSVFIAQQLASLSKSKRYQASFRLVPELAQHHFHCILLVRASQKANQIQGKENTLYILMGGEECSDREGRKIDGGHL